MKKPWATLGATPAPFLRLAVFVAMIFTTGSHLAPQLAMAVQTDMDAKVQDRKELMKQVGQAAKIAHYMASGKVPFEADRAAKAMQSISTIPAKFVKLFPAGSHTHPDSNASPQIWKNMADFLSKAEQLKRVSSAAGKAANNGADAFKDSFIQMTQACKGCHESYKIKKN